MALSTLNVASFVYNVQVKAHDFNDDPSVVVKRQGNQVYVKIGVTPVHNGPVSVSRSWVT